jgi:hypothetical protein
MHNSTLATRYGTHSEWLAWEQICQTDSQACPSAFAAIVQTIYFAGISNPNINPDVFVGEEVGGLAELTVAAAAGDGTTSIYRVSPAERGTSELDNGFDPANFPRADEPEVLDGAAHFGNEARAEDFARSHPDSHGEGMRIEVPDSWLENPDIDQWVGMTPEMIEYVIPSEMFDELNQFPRFPWSPGAGGGAEMIGEG